MARLTRIPVEIENQIYYTICQFGCARWKAVLTYAEALVMRNPDIPEEVRESNAQGAASKVVQSLQQSGRVRISYEIEDERLVMPARQSEISFDSVYAFDAFAALTYELAQKDLSPELCYAGKSETYPFHYIFAASKQKVIYRVIVYGHDAMMRIDFLNDTFNADNAKRSVTMLVIPDTYSLEEFRDVIITGKSRIAFITKANKTNKTYKCILTDVNEEE